MFLSRRLGYIGSHTPVWSLVQAGPPIMVTNLSNSNPESLKRVSEITGEQWSLSRERVRDEALLEKIFAEHEISHSLGIHDLRRQRIRCQADGLLSEPTLMPP